MRQPTRPPMQYPVMPTGPRATCSSRSRYAPPSLTIRSGVSSRISGMTRSKIRPRCSGSSKPSSETTGDRPAR